MEPRAFAPFLNAVAILGGLHQRRLRAPAERARALDDAFLLRLARDLLARVGESEVPGAGGIGSRMTAGLDQAEQELLRSVETRLPEQVAFLEKVVNIDSGTFNAAGVEEVARAFQRELESLGFTARWLPCPRRCAARASCRGRVAGGATAGAYC